MEWQVILAVILVVPVILLPVALVWFVNIGGLLATSKEARARRAIVEKGVKVAAKAK